VLLGLPRPNPPPSRKGCLEQGAHGPNDLGPVPDLSPDMLVPANVDLVWRLDAM